MGASSYGARLTSPGGGAPADPSTAAHPEPERSAGPLPGVVHPDARPTLDVPPADRWSIQNSQPGADEVRTVVGPGDVQRPAEPCRPVEPNRSVEPVHRLEPSDEHRSRTSLAAGHGVEAPVHPV